MMKRLRTLLLSILLTAQFGFSQTASQIVSVQVNAVADAAAVTLSWPSWPGSIGYTIYRKLKADILWGNPIGTTTSTSYADNNATTGVYYEYKVVRSASNGIGYGYIASGKGVPPVDYRGRFLILVDNAFTTSLTSQLSQLESDLVLDGWSVTRVDLDRSATAASVKATIVANYNSSPNLKAIYIIGHLAVPYSGNLNPDGHGDHLGAWPCDGYYGDVDGVWTDVSNPANGAQSSRNWNDPGDGKLDQSDYPSNLELAVGRVDFYNMVQNGGAFAYYQGQTESQLLSNYLTRAHNFKIKQFTPQFRGAMFNNFLYVADPLASSGYRSMSSLVGYSNITDFYPYAEPFLTNINNQSYLWTYFCGGGSWVSCANVGTTDQFAGSEGSFAFGGLFNMSLGSYFGDFDITNSFLVAPLASGGLTNVWSGIPNWWFHHMAMGDPIAYSTVVSQNNVTLYTPQNGGWQGSPYGRVAMNLLGDPSLRQVMVNMPSNLQVSNSSGSCTFSWQPASGVLGYHLYEITASGITRLTTNIVTSTSLSSTISYVQGKVFMVRGVVLETSPTGTYYNLSLGAKVVAPAPSSPTIRLSAKVLLDGPYKVNEGLMVDSLRVRGLLPLSQPYSGLGYVHTANLRSEVISSAVLLVSGPNAIVDWIVVELRSPSTNVVVGSRTGLLQRDGDVVDMDGISPLEFDLPAANYKVSVRHRNHLAATLNATLALSSVPTTANFITGTLYGTAPRTATGTLWPGDVNGDGTVRYTGADNDRDLILINLGSNPQAVQTGFYTGADVNMDGSVKYTGSANDRDLVLVTVGSTTPNNVKQQQIP